MASRQPLLFLCFVRLNTITFVICFAVMFIVGAYYAIFKNFEILPHSTTCCYQNSLWVLGADLSLKIYINCCMKLNPLTNTKNYVCIASDFLYTLSLKRNKI